MYFRVRRNSLHVQHLGKFGVPFRILAMSGAVARSDDRFVNTLANYREFVAVCCA